MAKDPIDDAVIGAYFGPYLASDYVRSGPALWLGPLLGTAQHSAALFAMGSAASKSQLQRQEISKSL